MLGPTLRTEGSSNALAARQPCLHLQLPGWRERLHTGGCRGAQLPRHKRQLCCSGRSSSNPCAATLTRQLAEKAASLAASLALSAALVLSSVQPAEAVLNSPNARIARTVDAALRRAIPAFNPDIRRAQNLLEDVQYKLRVPQRKPWGGMVDDAKTAEAIFSDDTKVLGSVPPGQEETARSLAKDAITGLKGLQYAIDSRDPDKVSSRVAKVLRSVSDLELLQAPGLPYSLPKEYRNLPHLVGRATVELSISREGEAGFVGRAGGGLQDESKLTLVLDGFSAPLTAGNFALRVQQGEFDNRRLGVEFASVICNPPLREAEAPPLPLEILQLASFEPTYRAQLEVNAGELPVLPLSIYGAVAMAHAPESLDGESSSNAFFLHKFVRSSSGLSGLSFDEGNFSVFGYCTGGIEFLEQIQPGDTIRSARLIAGQDKLIVPA